MLDKELKTGSYKVTYIVDIPGSSIHEGRIKVGDATYHTDKTLEQIKSESTVIGNLITSDEIVAATHPRIKQWTGTGDLPYRVIFAYLNVKPTSDGNYESFRDYDVHDVLMRSGMPKTHVTEDKNNGEWFKTVAENAVEAIKAVQEGRPAIHDVETVFTPVVLREEQKDAVKVGTKSLKGGTVEKPKKCLWNAIMRFGKTISAYALIQQMPEIQKVLILTHRPVVSAGWSEDFYKVFGFDSEWKFGARNKAHGVLWSEIEDNEKFVYFSSIQDIRGSFGEMIDEEGTQVFTKNHGVFETEFDLVIVDEGHEGTRTELSKKMMENISTRAILQLSGTPYNIISEFDEDEIYNWSYIDERKALEKWNKDKALWNEHGAKSGVKNPGEVNPYEKLPTIEILTIDLTKTIDDPRVKEFIDANRKVEFQFAEFFAVDETKTEKGQFVDSFHPFKDNKLVARLMKSIFGSDEFEDESDKRSFPFSTAEMKMYLAHTLWMLPSVKAAVALKEMLAKIAPTFHVINATADNDGGDALSAVKSAIKKNEYTITLSYNKLTTGTTIEEWTGVFMLSNMSSPMQYFQTIFRVKSAGSLKDGRQKDVGYVFDFDPNRSLKMASVAAASTVSKVDEKGKDKTYTEVKADEEKAVVELLNYLPIIAYDGARFEKRDSISLMKALNRVFIQETVQSGFSSNRLFDFDIHGVSAKDLEALLDVKKVLKDSKADEISKTVTISESEITTKEKEAAEKEIDDTKSDPKRKLTEAEEKIKKDKENGRNIVQVLRGVAVRVPLLVFARPKGERITSVNFSQVIDDKTWGEFMPTNFSKDMWDKVAHFFNASVFEGACGSIRERVVRMGKLAPLERVVSMAMLISTFKNPDRETVLTPFWVVNMQCANTIGGLRWVDEDEKWLCTDGEKYTLDEIENSDGELIPQPLFENPHFGTDLGNKLNDMWNSDSSTFYDINSKTALYPLFAAASLFKKRLISFELKNGSVMPMDVQHKVWQEIIENQIFINARVPYSKTIAQRVLAGYNDYEVNSSVVDIIDMRKALKTERVDKKLLSMKQIDSIIGWVLLGVKDKGCMSVDDRLEILDKDVKSALDKAEKSVERFSVVLSNPPYQLATEGNDRDSSIYHHFMNVSKLVSEKVSMIYPARWISGGVGDDLGEFRDSEINSQHYRNFCIFSGEKEIFKSATIKGGVNFFLWDENHVGEMIYIYDGKVEKRESLLNGNNSVILNPSFSSIIEKVNTKEFIKAYSSSFYGESVKTDYKIETLEKNLKDDDETYKVFYSGKKRGVNSALVPKCSTNKDTKGFKVFASLTADPDKHNSLRRPGRIFLGEENEICSSSFIQLISATSKKSSENCLIYLKTNFATTIFGIFCHTQTSTKRCYALIPDVNFETGEIKDKPGVFLDFEKPETLDEQLAEIYELDEDDQKLMASSIRPWKDKLSLTADGLY